MRKIISAPALFQNTFTIRNVRQKLLPGLFAIVFMLFANVVAASTSISDQVKRLLEDELYPVSSVLPRYQRPPENAPRFAVAEFRTVSEDRRIWSQAVSEILRYRIQYVPGVRLTMPAPYNTHADAQAEEGLDRPLLTDTQSFKGLQQTLGIEKVLTGRVDFSGNKIALDVDLVNAASGKVFRQRDWSFPADELPAVLIEVSVWVYRELGVKLTAEEAAYLEDPKTLTQGATEDFIANYEGLTRLNKPLRRDKIRQLREDHPNFTMLAIYALHSRAFARNLDDAYQNLDFYEGLRSTYRGNAGVALETFRVMEISALPKHKVAGRLNKMKDLAGANPQDPTIMISCASALVDNGATHEAIALLLEAVERWPEQYRAWWTLGWALWSHGWQIRGDSYWRDVPERAKKEFKALMILANKALDEALARNERSSGLWGMKIKAVGSRDGFTDEIIELFDRAVEIGPKNRFPYDVAINYSDNRWGGNPVARTHIIRTAEKNNPDATWVEVMKREYAEDSVSTPAKSFLDDLKNFIKAIF